MAIGGYTSTGTRVFLPANTLSRGDLFEILPQLEKAL
jgi:hypothetical protein